MMLFDDWNGSMDEAPTTLIWGSNSLHPPYNMVTLSLGNSHEGLYASGGHEAFYDNTLKRVKNITRTHHNNSEVHNRSDTTSLP